jgi:hypothetical protein
MSLDVDRTRLNMRRMAVATTLVVAGKYLNIKPVLSIPWKDF